jgi:hypothetical protein
MTESQGRETVGTAIAQAFRTLRTSLPIMFGILLLVNLVTTVARDSYPRLFTGNFLLDPLVGALAGSVSFGIPVTSYVVGGELLADGVSLLAVTAFILTWTTVGIAMLPLESKSLGMRFAFVRNAVNFVFAIVISVLTVLTLQLFV